MKKKVKVYKMQAGGATAEGQPQIEPQLLLGVITKSLTNGTQPDEIYQSLLKQGIDKTMLDQLMNDAVNKVNDYIEDNTPPPSERPTNVESEPTTETSSDNKQLMNMIMQDDDVTEDMLYETSPALLDDDDLETARYGKVVSKNAFVRNVMKQVGGASGIQRASLTDNTGEGIKGNFVNGLNQASQMAMLKSQIEQQYDMMNEQNMLPAAQRGGQQRRQDRRQNRQMNRMYKNISRMIPSGGFYDKNTSFQGAPMNIINFTGQPGQGMQGQGMPMGMNPYGIKSLDVRKSGLFGRPKRYSMEFFPPYRQAHSVHNDKVRVLPGKDSPGNTTHKSKTPSATPRKTYVPTAIDNSGTSTGSSHGGGNTNTPIPKELPLNTDPTIPLLKDIVYPNYVPGENPTTTEAAAIYSGDFNNPGSYWKEVNGKWYKKKLDSQDRSNVLQDWTELTGQELKDAKAGKGRSGQPSTNLPADFDWNQNSRDRAAHAENLFAQPQAAMADDALIQNLALMGAGFGTKLMSQPFQFKPFVKGFLPKGNPQGMNPIGLPKGPGAFSRPGAWGGGPKGLPWSGSNVHYLEDGGELDMYQGDEQSEVTNTNVSQADYDKLKKQMAFMDQEMKNRKDYQFPMRYPNRQNREASQFPMRYPNNQGRVVTGTSWNGSPVYGDPNDPNYVPPGNPGYGIDPHRPDIYGTQNPYPMYPPLFGGGRNRGGRGRWGQLLNNMRVNPAIQYAGSWNQQQGPVRGADGKPYTGGFGNSYLKEIDVRKSGLFGRPKKWTATYGIPGSRGSEDAFSGATSGSQLYRGSDGTLRSTGNSPQGAADQTMTDEQYEAQFPERSGRGKMADFFYKMGMDKVGSKFEPWGQGSPTDIQGAPGSQPKSQPKPESKDEAVKQEMLPPPDVEFPSDDVNIEPEIFTPEEQRDLATGPSIGNLPTRPSGLDPTSLAKFTGPQPMLGPPDVEFPNEDVNIQPDPEFADTPNTDNELLKNINSMKQQFQDIQEGRIRDPRYKEGMSMIEYFNATQANPNQQGTRVGEPIGSLPTRPSGLDQASLAQYQINQMNDRMQQADMDPYEQHMRNLYEANNPTGSQYDWQPEFTDEDAAGIIDMNPRPRPRPRSPQVSNVNNRSVSPQQQVTDRLATIEGMLQGSQGYIQPWQREALIKEKDSISKSGQLRGVTVAESTNQGWKRDPRPGRSAYMVSPKEFARIQRNMGSQRGGQLSQYQTFGQVNEEPQFGYSAPTDFGVTLDNPWATAADTDMFGDPTNALHFNTEGDAYVNEGIQYPGSDPSEFSVDQKRKDMWNIDGNQLRMNKNLGLNVFSKFLEDRDNAPILRKQYQELAAGNQDGVWNYPNQGFDPNSGLIRKQGATRYVREEGGQTEGSEVYMSEEEIQDFLSRGGQLDFI